MDLIDGTGFVMKAVHFLIEEHYMQHGVIPNIVLVTPKQYHLLEKAFKFQNCFCKDPQGRAKRYMTYTVAGKVVRMVMEGDEYSKAGQQIKAGNDLFKGRNN
ncbi:hypothetical protein LCGC14_0359480 [marine sediment metagenome]|uniref:Uncharacterized protein n=1 Tax=marine sediment metagenome TaxID=412755 RepID=A0A0F9WGN6_9ZZZZ|nr:hypothetical protein [Candidatus Aminicenantes bacterium]